MFLCTKGPPLSCILAHNHHLDHDRCRDNEADSNFDGHSVGLAADHLQFPYPNASLSIILPAS